MSFDITVSGASLEAVERIVPQLVTDLVASRIAGQDSSLWGQDAEAEAAKRLGWTEAVVVSDPLVPDILALRDRLRSAGVDHVVLGGMGGSSLAPEVITRTAGVELTILDTTSPGQILAALSDRLPTTAVVISSKSGSTVETDSHKRVYEKAFRDAGIDPIERIVVVTDPGSPLDVSARADGYRVFNADPNVGGRYSALTAFGLVPAGLAGVDIAALLDEASSVAGRIAVDQDDNPALILGAAIAGTRPLKDKLGIIADGTYIVGFADWAEQLIAESTGKLGKGLLPVVLEKDAPELGDNLPDLQIVRLVESARATEEVEEGEIEISGTLGAQMLVWETAIAVAGRILGIDPFDQPDVESAKEATRGLLNDRPELPAPAFVDGGIEARATADALTASGSILGAIDALLAQLPSDGYLSIQAYLNRHQLAKAVELRELLAARADRPVTFGWGPRFLHSTGQFHKGGPAVGVFLQLTADEPRDLEIPDRPFTFGELIRAQAQGDAAVLALHGRPVLTLTLTEPADGLRSLLSLLS
ncbi:glucose-6-phosphate isomerase [Cryobacterium mesophilum]|uniref:Glucose-6-phosphate isomerase n=1 Tax=Terrimesophilobacter mesophilus TaxID=433647 RepID=A0A4R8V9U7_9MICO|nr:glucose-6-phosphate isomerase [Terrimesophilobacter mesophilus]MBB5631937.1 glucose-6-phosphate isomerase [Terrimesophilobacter mesophilus]TFB78840.1 glucose-6-phosphate isomerase [Terrimesophilobacter mesophilus]